MTVWDSKHVHDLLQRPQRLLHEEVWRSLVRQHGGLAEIYTQLRALPLPPDQQRLLERVLAEPGRTVAYYADVLGIHVTTYHRYWRKLVATCSTLLNHTESIETTPERMLVLPTMLTSFVGRETVLAPLQTMLEQGTRLVTLMGVGGAGKTRLALELARRTADAFHHGVVFVGLAHVEHADQVWAAIAHAFGSQESSGRSIAQQLTTVLHDKHVLVVLDNVEQIASISGIVSDLLDAAPRLAMVVTSRTMLHVYGEHVVHVPPLSVPQHPTDLADVYAAEAVRLFVERAHAVEPALDFDDAQMTAIASICQQLDGVPLAVELAAARVRVLSPHGLLQRMNRSLDVLSGGARNLPTRQQSVRDLMGWSYRLLAPAEQRAFAALGVFAEGWTIESAAHVLQFAVDAPELLDILTSLLDSSLIVRDANADQRWRMLHLVRDYAAEQLSLLPDADNVRERASTWLIELAEASVNGLKGSEQQHWLQRLDREQTNVHAGLRWLIEHHKSAQASRLGGALWQYWWMRGMFSAGRHMLEQVIAVAHAVEPALQVRALNGAGALAWSQADYQAAQGYFEQCLAIQQHLNDERGVAMTRNNIGLIAVKRGDYDAATHLFEANRNVFAQLNDEYSHAASLSNLGMVARYQGDYDRAQELFQASLVIRQQLGNRWGIATSQTNLAMIAMQQGLYDRALMLYRESLLLLAEVGERDSIAECFEGLAGVFWGKQQPERAAQLCGAADGLRASIATPRTSVDQAWFGAMSDAIQAALGAGKFEQAWASGYSQPVDALISDIVELTQPFS